MTGGKWKCIEMMKEEILLQSERERLLREARALTDNPAATKADLKRADVLIAQASGLKSRYERQVRLADAMGVPLEQVTRGAVTEEQRNAAEERESFRRYVAYGDLPQHRTYSPLTEDNTGFIVPQTFFKTLLTGVSQYTELFDSRNVRLIETDNARIMKLPQIDLSSISSSIVGQGADAAPVANPIIGGLTLNRFTYRTNPIAATIELEQDSFEDITEILVQAFGVGLARGIGSDLVSGSGSGAPQGILTAASDSTVTSASSTGFTKSELQAMYFSVNRAYRVSPKCAWLMNDITYNAILGLKDATTNRPLVNITEDGEKLFGKRILLSPDMPTAAGSKAVLFGDFGQYVVRVARNSVKVRRNFEVPNYAEKGAALYTCYVQIDAALNAPNGVAPVVYGTLHA
jgi:HK97 family phage major capsid protein